MYSTALVQYSALADCSSSVQSELQADAIVMPSLQYARGMPVGGGRKAVLGGLVCGYMSAQFFPLTNAVDICTLILGSLTAGNEILGKP